MSETNESNPLFNRDERDNLVEEIPSQLYSSNYEKIPSGYEPMGEIRLRGRAASSFARGRMPWWTLITGWLIFGSIALITIFVGIKMIFNGMYLEAIFPWLIGLIIFSILWRGTKAKLRKNKRRHNRQ